MWFYLVTEYHNPVVLNLACCLFECRCYQQHIRPTNMPENSDIRISQNVLPSPVCIHYLEPAMSSRGCGQIWAQKNVMAVEVIPTKLYVPPPCFMLEAKPGACAC